MVKVSYKTVGNYKIDQNNKVIVADFDKLTDNEKHIISMYISAGYILKEKQKGLTYKDMEKSLKNDKEGLEKLKEKIAEKNYMATRSWYKKYFDELKNLDK